MIRRAALALKIVGGALATATVIGLGVCFWPQVKADRISAKPAVARPVFIAASPAKSPPQAPATPAIPVAIAPPNLEKVGIDKLAAALKTDLSAPSPGAAAAPPVNAEAAQFCARGLIALANGDIAAARRWLERAADAGDPRALVALGDAYNPAMLARLGVLGAPGDTGLARAYYDRAVNAGLSVARDRLASLAMGVE